MSKHLSPKQRVDIINDYLNNLTPMIFLAKQYNVTRQAVWKIIKQAGIDAGEQGTLWITCDACGNEFKRLRHKIRKQKNHFCSLECYYAFLEAGRNGGAYVNNRQGQRIARAKVSEYFDLQPRHVVHHIDRNTLNNDPHNLMVFRNQGDHVRYHRLGADYVQPIWDGRDL